MGMFQWNTWKKFVKYMVESAKGNKVGISRLKIKKDGGNVYDDN